MTYDRHRFVHKASSSVIKHSNFNREDNYSNANHADKHTIEEQPVKFVYTAKSRPRPRVVYNRIPKCGSTTTLGVRAYIVFITRIWVIYEWYDTRGTSIYHIFIILSPVSEWCEWYDTRGTSIYHIFIILSPVYEWCEWYDTRGTSIYHIFIILSPVSEWCEWYDARGISIIILITCIWVMWVIRH